MMENGKILIKCACLEIVNNFEKISN